MGEQNANTLKSEHIISPNMCLEEMFAVHAFSCKIILKIRYRIFICAPLSDLIHLIRQF